MPADRLREAFCVFDKNGDGCLSRDEFVFVLTKLGNRFTDAEADVWLAKYDSNHDGRINLDEFVAMMRKRCAHKVSSLFLSFFFSLSFLLPSLDALNSSFLPSPPFHLAEHLHTQRRQLQNQSTFSQQRSTLQR